MTWMTCNAFTTTPYCLNNPLKSRCPAHLLLSQTPDSSSLPQVLQHRFYQRRFRSRHHFPTRDFGWCVGRRVVASAPLRLSGCHRIVRRFACHRARARWWNALASMAPRPAGSIRRLSAAWHYRVDRFVLPSAWKDPHRWGEDRTTILKTRRIT